MLSMFYGSVLLTKIREAFRRLGEVFKDFEALDDIE